MMRGGVGKRGEWEKREEEEEEEGNMSFVDLID